MNELIHRQNLKLADLIETQQNGDTSPLLAANTKQAEDRLDELNGRLEGRQRDLAKGAQLHYQRHSATWVGLGAATSGPGQRRDVAAMVRDDEIEAHRRRCRDRV